MHVGYVRTRSGSILLQLPAANHWGFVLADDEQSWPGGFGWEEWEPIAEREVPERKSGSGSNRCWNRIG